MTLGRRAFVAAMGGGLLAAPFDAAAQPSGRPARVGYLFSFVPATGRHLWDACRQGVRELGYVEDRTIVLEPRWADGHHDRLPGLAADLVRRKVDVIVSAATPASQAARAATAAIPIVIVAVADPVKAGLVANLARPGGNVTGLSLLTPELSGKRLELLTEVVRSISVVAVLTNPENPSHAFFLAETAAAAQRVGARLQPLEARNGDDIQALPSRIGGASGMIVFDDPVIWSHREAVVRLAAERRLPMMYGYSDFVDEGGLMSYGPDRVDMYRRTAGYVDRILRGARPAELPIEQPTKFELVINRKTAARLGLTLPQPLLLRATRVIE
jgi:putative ABC transport system substrate-binding protein